MTQELRMLLKLDIRTVRSPDGQWNASFMDKSYRSTGTTPFKAIRTYLDWVEMRLQSGDTDEEIASDFGIDPFWIDSLREVLGIEKA